MKKLNKQQIDEIGNSVFVNYPREKKIYITADGMPFLTEPPAKDHARRFSPKLEIYELEKAEAKAKAKAKAEAKAEAEEKAEVKEKAKDEEKAEAGEKVEDIKK